MAIESENGILAAYPQTHRLTVRLSKPEYDRLCEIANHRWDYPVSRNHAVKRMIRTFFMGDEVMKKVVKG